MTKFIAIENDSDFDFLSRMFERALNKIKTNASKFDLDQAETIIRINDSIQNASKNLQEIENHIEENDAIKKRVSKNPKSSRKTSQPAKMRANLCEDHPYYGAIRSPQHDCSGCWNAYKSLNPNNFEKKRRDFERKMAKQANG